MQLNVTEDTVEEVDVDVALMAWNIQSWRRSVVRTQDVPLGPRVLMESLLRSGSILSLL